MAKSNSIGTSLTVNNIAVGGLTSIDGINVSAENIDVSDLSNADGYREKLPGFKDGGEVSVSGFLDGANSGQAQMYSVFESGAVVPCVVTFPTKIGKKWTFNAGITSFKTGADVGGAITFEATLLVSGKPSFASSGTITAYPDEVTVAAGAAVECYVTAANGAFTATATDNTKAKPYVVNGKVVITGVAAGSTTVTLTDTASATETITVTVTA